MAIAPRLSARALVLLAAATAFARAEDPVDLIRRAVQAERENRSRMVNYLFLESITRRSYDRNGELINEQSSEFEVIFLEGRPAFRRVSVNGRPLTAEEEQAERARLRQLAEDRKRSPDIPSPAEERRRAHPFPLFLQFHEFRMVTSDSMDGKECWVVESHPRKKRKAKTNDEERVLSSTARFWIDKESLHRVRMDVTALKPSGPAKIREETSYRWGQRDGSVWLITEIRTTLPLSGGGKGIAWYRGEQRYSNYRRFSSESRVSVVDELSDPPH